MELSIECFHYTNKIKSLRVTKLLIFLGWGRKASMRINVQLFLLKHVKKKKKERGLVEQYRAGDNTFF